MKGSKACQHTNYGTRLPSAARRTGALCDCFRRTTRQVFLFSCEPLHPVVNSPSPLPLQSSVHVKRLPTGHLLKGALSIATPDYGCLYYIYIMDYYIATPLLLGTHPVTWHSSQPGPG